MRKTIDIKLTDEYKEEVMNLIDDTIEKVIKREHASLSAADKRKIKNLALDQVNVNVTARSKLKSLWVFDSADCLTMIVEPDRKNKVKKGGHIKYTMRPNLTWLYGSEGITRKEFEERALEMLAEDVETAAFYGTLSYIT